MENNPSLLICNINSSFHKQKAHANTSLLKLIHSFFVMCHSSSYVFHSLSYPNCSSNSKQYSSQKSSKWGFGSYKQKRIILSLGWQLTSHLKLIQPKVRVAITEYQLLSSRLFMNNFFVLLPDCIFASNFFMQSLVQYISHSNFILPISHNNLCRQNLPEDAWQNLCAITYDCRIVAVLFFCLFLDISFKNYTLPTIKIGRPGQQQKKKKRAKQRIKY